MGTARVKEQVGTVYLLNKETTMEFITNIANVKSSAVASRSTASKLAADKAAKEGALLRQQLAREIALKNAALREKAAIKVLLERRSEEVEEAYRQISCLEDQIFSLEAEIKELRSRKSRKEKKQEAEEPSINEDTSNS